MANQDLKYPLLPVLQDSSTPGSESSLNSSTSTSLKSLVFILLGPLLCTLICLCLNIDKGGRNMLAVTIWVFEWWLTEAVPMPITSMSPLFLFPLFGIAAADVVAKSYMNDVIALVLGSFILALAVEHYNIHRRLALNLIAELIGTYFWIFAGDAAIIVNSDKDKVVTLPGIAIVWGLVLMVMIYSVGHISSAHFNPAVTIAFASCKRFPWKEVPAYIAAQLGGATLASGTLRLLFSGTHDHFAGTLPTGTHAQSFALEFIITFSLMFVISSVATDNRAIGELAGLVIGSILLLNVIIAGPISGASMNPVRSLGPTIVSSNYDGIWIYMISPILGAIAGA